MAGSKKFEYQPLLTSKPLYGVSYSMRYNVSSNAVGESSDIGDIPKAFINADDMMSSIHRSLDGMPVSTNASNDVAIRVSFKASVDGFVDIKMVELGGIVYAYTNNNGGFPAGGNQIYMYNSAQNELVPKRLRPANPVIARIVGLGEIGNGFTTSQAFLQSEQFLRFNPDGTIDAQMMTASIFDAAGSTDTFYALSTQWARA